MCGKNQKEFLVKKGMMMAAGLCCLLGITFNSVAMGTNSWIVSEGEQILESLTNGTSDTSDRIYIWVNYGLFSGEKKMKGPVVESLYSLTVYCPNGEGICLVSCGRNELEQKAEFDYLIFGNEKFTCTPTSRAAFKAKSNILVFTGDNFIDHQLLAKSKSNAVRQDDQFMEYGLWITTIIFLSLMIACQVIAAGLCALNTATVPIESWVGPMGIYVSNLAGGLFGLITLSLWGDLYSSNLSSELAVQETILDTYSMTSTGLGFSYWFVFISLMLTIVCCVCIRFRNVLKKISHKEVENSNAAPGVLIY